MPAAPSVWPVTPLVELAWVRAGKRRATSAASTSSFLALAVPCRLMWSTRLGVDAGARQRIVECALGAEPFGMRRRHVVGIARFAVAEQAQRAAVAGVDALEQGEAGGLADADAAALGVERPARLGRDQLQGVEAEQHAAAQGVDAADHRRIDEAQAQQPLGRREHLGARRAGGRDGDARPFEAERVVDEVGERVRRVDERVAVVGREARRRRRGRGRRLRWRRCSRSRCRGRARRGPAP